jgi:hypothetical protein
MVSSAQLGNAASAPDGSTTAAHREIATVTRSTDSTSIQTTVCGRGDRGLYRR